jgi:H/ACA ribonucleoprotein complex subunit 3
MWVFNGDFDEKWYGWVILLVCLLRKCIICGEYTLNQDSCPLCEGKVHTPHPAKFSPEDRYAKYRHAMKRLSQNEINSD